MPGMAENEWTDGAADRAREAAERRETGGASVPAGGAKGPGDLRVPAERREPPQEAPDEPPRRAGVVPPPEREEAPELLGEQSDYPISRPDPDRDPGA
ncbi:hypothetical protein PSR1_01619 [Anaeromyxobacter sp. PSR-1]|nr:hypothetical protein PSR1_01619 [Anaeromyxobacter sp. PSR-1]